ncbi:ectonucleoside triphosphate diphosphohydrolase 8-like isoform X3 [Cuculus canorus]|uniref:ectonucleoside triphosphate diphosphohydrolase 8-like isoform X3 n=3 Tax=Cuculus canorus TaxID=55661 RepID=UPI0023AAF16F|nr:ectonucleoside triphosphate diphosphohydrolase 8-like isoform X3 [Cuculus canorus]
MLFPCLEQVGGGMGSKAKVVAGLLAATCIFSIIALILSVVNVKDAFLPPSTKYGLVFDAGSMHTALYIYRWPADKENGTGIVSQVEACTVSGPGISSYADDPTGAGASLKPCLDKAMKIIPAKQQPETPTYLGATAGMRLLRAQNSTKAEQVFAEVAKVIGEYPVDFRGAQILTGNEEGSFGWVTVNYLLETLVKFSFSEKWEHPQDTEVLGALDLGGASTQITFQPGVTIEDKNTSVFFRLYGTNYSLYTHSYLCYGQTQALKMLLAALHQGSPSPQQISHPCYPKGYQENTTTAELYDSPCVRAPSTPSPAQVLTVTGTGDPAACSSAIQKLFNFSCGAKRTCGFNGVYQPPVRGQFFAFAGFYYTFHFLNLTSQRSLSDVNSTVQTFCKKNWTELVETFPQDKKYLQTYCSTAIYILTLLLDGYKFNEHTWSSIHFSQQAANTDIGWTLGFMLNFTNMIPTEALELVKGHQPSLWAGAISLIVLAIVAGLVAAFLQCFWKTK